MRAMAGRSAHAARVASAPRSAGEGVAIGLGWLIGLAGRWSAFWVRAVARLASDPSTFVNQR